MGRVLVIGGSNTDLVCRAPRLPVAGETLTGSDFSVFAGGKGANQAVAAARAGANVTFAGAVGDDDFGQQRLADLSADGIDVSCVERVADAASGVALIVVDDHGENQIVVIPGANAQVSVAAIDQAIDSRTPDVALMVLELPLDVTRHSIERLRGRTIIVLNAAPFDPDAALLLSMVDVLVCNEVEAAGLLGRPVEPESAEDDVLELRTLCSGCAVITLGEHGVVAANAEDHWWLPAFQVDAVDTTGAGDAFCGALAAWLAEGASLRSAVTAGAVAGAFAVTKAGAQPSLPHRRQIEALLRDLQAE